MTLPPGDIDLVRELIALQRAAPAPSLAERRSRYDSAARSFGCDRRGEVVDAGGCRAEWVRAPLDRAQPVVVYLHGGSYLYGSAESHRHLSAEIGRAADAAVLAVDYRRAPEHPFPAAVDDAVAATRWARANTGGPLVLAGDSAGGGLVMAAMLALRDGGDPLPAAGVCLSPWVDLTCGGASHTALAYREPLLDSAELRSAAAAYLGGADPKHPLASPALADLTGLPPLLVQVGSDEILLDDSRALARAARAAGVRVEYDEWPGMVHVWQWYHPVLTEGRAAIERIGTFVRRACAPPAPERAGPASPLQEAHVLVAPLADGHGFLSWVYQLNGALDVPALRQAVDDVVEQHDMLRVRFGRRDGRLYQVVRPFAPGVLDVIDLRRAGKADGLAAAFDDVVAFDRALSPAVDAGFTARLYRVDAKTAVLAMFVAESLVDSDSAPLVAGALTRAYAAHSGHAEPADLPPEPSPASYVDHVAAHPPHPAAEARAREHWTAQARAAAPLAAWPVEPRGEVASTSFVLAPEEWAAVTSAAAALRVSAFVHVLAALQVALLRVTGLRELLVHSIATDRSDPATDGMIGNFQSIVRVDARVDPADRFADLAARTAAAVRKAVAHHVVPAPLADAQAGLSLPSGPVPPVRFYLFENREGPVFAGVRRRRFRLPEVCAAPLRLNCVYGPAGRQDFVFTSATAPPDLLDRLAAAVRAALDGAVLDPGAAVADRESLVSGEC